MSKKKSQIILAQIEGNEVLVDSSDIKTEYPQIQIVTSVESPSPSLNKNKLIFIGEGEDGTEIYGQEAGDSFALAQEGVSNVSGVVESVIEVAGNPVDNGTDGTGKPELQEFTFVEESKFTLIDGMEEENSAPSLPRDFECELCNKKFTKVEILKRHIKTHLKDKEFKCSYCSKTFDRRDVLNDHIRNHTGEKPFECNICKKKFTRGFVLLRHMRTHGEGLYKCDFCHKGFDRKDTYRDHMRNHTGEKPFKCKFCGKAFSRSFVLTKHEKSHIIREEMGNITDEQSIGIEFVDSDNIEVQEVDFEDEESVKQATDMLLQKELGEEVIEGVVEQEIVQDEHDFKVIEPQDMIQAEEASMHVEQVEEVVETEAITLATADGQIVRVISKEQYDRLLAVASKSKTYKCDTCNRRFTNTNAFQNHYHLRWEEGGCIN